MKIIYKCRLCGEIYSDTICPENTAYFIGENLYASEKYENGRLQDALMVVNMFYQLLIVMVIIRLIERQVFVLDAVSV